MTMRKKGTRTLSDDFKKVLNTLIYYYNCQTHDIARE